MHSSCIHESVRWDFSRSCPLRSRPKRRENSGAPSVPSASLSKLRSFSDRQPVCSVDYLRQTELIAWIYSTYSARHTNGGSDFSLPPCNLFDLRPAYGVAVGVAVGVGVGVGVGVVGLIDGLGDGVGV